MNALDILGGLLGGSSPQSGQSAGRQGGGGGSGGGFGGSILEELLKAGMGRSSAPAPQPTRTTSRSGSVSQRPIDVSSEVNRLEDLLGVANGRRQGSATGAGSQAGASGRSTAEHKSMPAPGSYRQPPALTPGRAATQQTTPRSDQARYQPPASQSQSSHFPSSPFPTDPNSSGQTTTEDEAIILICAMINAAKADGKLDDQEQEAILGRVPNDQATINFLRQEFSRPLDVREYAWSVPIGMEVQVYTLSLAAIQVDSRAELQYLKELAHGLRMDPALCNQIHERYGLQPLY